MRRAGFRQLSLMDSQVVEDDDTAAGQGWSELGLGIGIEGGAVHRVKLVSAFDKEEAKPLPEWRNCAKY